MKRALVLAALAFSYAACQKPGEDDGAEVCRQARAHQEECELEKLLPADAECTEREECTAACINAASCGELASPEAEGSYVDCLSDCAEKAQAGTRPCEEALERFESCGVDTSGVSVPNCTGEDLCVANCVNDATCAEIRREGAEGRYSDCLAAC